MHVVFAKHLADGRDLPGVRVNDYLGDIGAGGEKYAFGWKV